MTELTANTMSPKQLSLNNIQVESQLESVKFQASVPKNKTKKIMSGDVTDRSSNPPISHRTGAESGVSEAANFLASVYSIITRPLPKLDKSKCKSK